jgi:hypothetical protein
MKNKIYMNVLVVTLAALSVFAAAVPSASAATYFAMAPGDETCVSVQFGNSGRGEYTLRVSDPGEALGTPWVDVHFTSLLARPDNIVTVPVCFSAIGRKIGDSAPITMTISTPKGEQEKEYGICVSRNEDVDLTGDLTQDPCEGMGDHTDLFTASLTEPEIYVSPGEEVEYTLVIDSTVDATAMIAKSSGQMAIAASLASVEVGDGAKSVTLTMQAPAQAGDYPFGVMVSLDGCALDNCRREAQGILHVMTEEDEGDVEEAALFIWLTPEAAGTTGTQAKQLTLDVRNYGNGQKVTVAVSVEEGLETDFSPYTVYIEKGEEKEMPVMVVPTSPGNARYRIAATATGEDGKKRSAEAWLTVDEMVADAGLLGEDDFVDNYDPQTVTLDEWVDVDPTGAAAPDDGESPDAPAVPEWSTIMLIVAAVIAAAAIAGAAFLLYRRFHGKGVDEYSALEKSLR